MDNLALLEVIVSLETVLMEFAVILLALIIVQREVLLKVTLVLLELVPLLPPLVIPTFALVDPA
jgi:hypothetical protein